MSDHVWAQENLATHLAGGLSADEVVRLEQHVAACPACATALAQARRVDQELEAVFTDARPDSALEDRMIHAIRAAVQHRSRQLTFYIRAAVGAAAVLVLGVFGNILSEQIGQQKLLYPWEYLQPRTEAYNHMKQIGLATHNIHDALRSLGDVGNTIDLNDASSGQLKDANELASVAAAKELQGRPAGTLDEQGIRQLRSLGYLRGGEAADGASGQQGQKPEPAVPQERLGGNAGRNVSVQGWSQPAEKAGASADVTNLTPENNQLGYSPPGRALVVKGSSHLYYRDDRSASPVPMLVAPVATPPYPGQVLTYPSSAAGISGSGGGSGSGKGSGGFIVGSDAGFNPGDRFARLQVPNAPEQDARRKKEIFALAEQSPADKQSGAGDRAGERKPGASTEKTPAAAVTTRKIIRSGEIEFEVESFDATVAAITRLLDGVPGGFIATINSDKLPNGKVRGTVVVRVPPDRLDGFLLDMRKHFGKTGELKGQRIGSQDITKQYTDLESRLRAARAMEERLLQIIKTGKGEIKDLLQVEKELGVWRTRIEEIEGELRFYASQVALSTLSISLYEREIRAAAEVVATERVQMGLEVEDVEKAQREALAAVAAAKGRINRSELKQHGAGQYNAILEFEVAQDSAGPVRDRLKQLGEVARLEVDRLMQNEGGTGKPADGKVRRRDTVFLVSLYNLTNVAPRQTFQITLACVDVESAYQALNALGRKEGSKVVASLNRQRGDDITGTVNLEVRTAAGDAILQAIKEAGEVLRLQTADNADVQNSTRSKRGFVVQLVALGMVEPRETETLKLAAKDVPAAFAALQEAVNRAKGRILRSQLNEQDRQNVTADLDFDLRRTEEAGIRTALTAAGGVYARTVSRAPEGDNKTDSKFRLQVQVVNVTNLRPRETVLLGVEVGDVDAVTAQLAAYTSEAGGRIVESHQSRERSGRIITRAMVDVPLAAAPALVERVKSAGILRTQEASRDPQGPDGPLATARLDVTLSNTDLIVPSDQGLWPRIRQGLSTSFTALSWSLTVVIVGLFFVLPWALVLYVIYRIVSRLRRRMGTTTTA